jgi:acetylornithine aminotransferase
MKLFNVYPINDIEISHGRGSLVYDKHGQEYLDMYGGHAVISIGHSHPHYLARLKEQMDALGFYSNSIIIPQQQALAERLGQMSGLPDYQLFFVNSGAEANENAMKLASFHNGKKKVIAFRKGFHGRTSLAVAVTDNPNIVAPVNQAHEVVFLPWNDVEALEQAFLKEGHLISSVIVEGIQGIGGIHEASIDFLKAIRALCDTYNAAYIADAVQCGYGRSGAFYAHDIAGVKADIYSMAKGMGNGFPIGAIAIAPHFQAKHGMLGTTFGGNHLACAAGLAVLEVMAEENLMANAEAMGNYLMQQLRQFPEIKEVRGRGLMIGIELPETFNQVRKHLLWNQKIFTGVAHPNVIRLLPALNLNQAHADRFLDGFYQALHTA